MPEKLCDLTRAMLCASEKGASIARVIRSDPALLALLVEEKTGDQKNKRFVQDFKTLADVLIQETVRHDLGKQFPALTENILGEESNHFTNTLGESVTIELQATEEETCILLARVLDGNKEAAKSMAGAIHSKVDIESYPQLDTVQDEVTIENVGIWIDPIDSTGQYIHGYDDQQADQNGVFQRGLQCVTVLIGAFDTQSGLPIVGTVNQPFAVQDPGTKRWQGRTVWGICHNGTRVNHLPAPSPGKLNDTTTDLIVISTSEEKQVQTALKEDFRTCSASGAGYKFLCAIDNLVGAYVLTQDTTFKWDACGPHAILLSMGRGVLDIDKCWVALKGKKIQSEDDVAPLLAACQVRYDQPDPPVGVGAQKWRNAGGVIAYTDVPMLCKILQKLQ